MFKLVSAINYAKEIEDYYNKIRYTEELILLRGFLGYDKPRIPEYDENGNYFNYAVLSDDKLIGYIAYQIDWYSLSAYNFGIVSFEKGNPDFGLALRHIMNNIINVHHIHRIEYRMVGGNPVKKHYDRFCERYNGRIIEFKDCFKDYEGNYRNEYVYEIIL